MVEEMYQQEAKEDEDGGVDEDRERKQNNNSNNKSGVALAQTPTPTESSSAPSTTTTLPPAPVPAPAGKRSEITNENDPSILAINRQCFSENQAKHSPSTTATTIITPTTDQVAPPPSHAQPFHDLTDETCRRGSNMVAAAEYGTTSVQHANAGPDIGPTLIRFGTTATAGDVSLTLGLRHAGNMPEKGSAFSFRDFGNC